MDKNNLDQAGQTIVAVAPYLIIAISLPLLILFPVAGPNHDIVLAVLSAVCGAATGPRIARDVQAGVSKLVSKDASVD